MGAKGMAGIPAGMIMPGGTMPGGTMPGGTIPCGSFPGIVGGIGGIGGMYGGIVPGGGPCAMNGIMCGGRLDGTICGWPGNGGYIGKGGRAPGGR